MNDVIRLHVTQEDEVLERLNAADNPRGFFIEVVRIVEECVDRLIRSAFRQEDYAVKYAIEPLLNRQGPLSELPVRLKLILALGMISAESYQDLELFIKLRNWLADDIRDYAFSDPVLFGHFQQLHCLQRSGIPFLAVIDPGSDAALQLMQRERQDQIVRSALLLSVSAAVLAICKESPI